MTICRAHRKNCLRNQHCFKTTIFKIWETCLFPLLLNIGRACSSAIGFPKSIAWHEQSYNTYPLMASLSPIAEESKRYHDLCNKHCRICWETNGTNCLDPGETVAVRVWKCVLNAIAVTSTGKHARNIMRARTHTHTNTKKTHSRMHAHAYTPRRTRTHTHTHAHTHAQKHTRAHTRTHTHTHTRTHRHTHTHAHARTHARTHTHTCERAHTHSHTHVRFLNEYIF